MILQDTPFQFFTIWSGIESGLYYAIIGFYVLIFFYFLLMRFRTSKKAYWLFFSLLFLFLAVGRVFFIIYYFYAPEFVIAMSDAELVNLLMILYRFATLFTWVGIACLMVILGILVFPPLAENIEIKSGTSFKDKLKGLLREKYVRLTLKLVLIIVPIIIGVAALILPDSLFMDPDFVDRYPSVVNLSSLDLTFFGYPAGRAVLNFILLPIFVAIVPFLYLSLAKRTFGVLRRSYALNAIGFLIYFLGRILQGVLNSLDFPHVSATLSPLLILLSLLLIVIANNYEQLK
ncbi:MAG: hypothetical protein KGD73_05040 [Candidatus Lokiarchaeota archaeon]|nr:hypothetical protein [Candidatus Lokiarchaeota archaeon]